MNILIIILCFIGLLLNTYDYNLFLKILAFIWYIASILIIYSSIKFSLQYKFIQLNIKKIFKSIKSKSSNNISPISSLCISLAAKIGVGSLSGVALAIYYGGIGTIFWMFIISILVAINTYVESVFGIRYREYINNKFIGGPSYYIRKILNNRSLSIIYSILVIIGYSGLFLSIQANTIVSTISSFNIDKIYIVIVLFLSTFIIILLGVNGIAKANKIIVPIMIILYFILGGYITIINYYRLSDILVLVLKEALNIKCIIPVFLIGMQRAIFITESSIGTSAIAASTCDNSPDKQGLLEVLGIYLTTFIIVFTTFILIVTSNYETINFSDINGIEIVIYAIKYHFGNIGGMILSIITVLFAFSTIISSYYFGESNLLVITKNKLIKYLFILLFMLVIIISCYIRASFLWNLTDYLVALLIIINVYAMLKISKKV